uniref:Protein kinase domain-containing protein n=1 Tax=Rhabditophanes sp. KR3021 TaxID=114890 RepID=A0AC35TZG0_9BILA
MNVFRWMLLIFWLWNGANCASLNKLHELPHCTKTTTMEGTVTDTDDTGRNVNVYSTTQLQMGLHDSVCLQISDNTTLTDSSLLHTIQYLRLEQHYPVIGSYKFGIPEVSSTCLCDCAGGDNICDLKKYHYQNCTQGSVCYRTFRPSQSSVGCFNQEKSEVCCEIKIEPFNQWKFTAIKIKQPDTVIIFRYRIFERIKQKWRDYSDDTIEVPLDKGIAKFELNNYHKIELSITGSRPNRQLEPGLYFWQHNEPGLALRGGVTLNDIAETSMDKLGWMRYEKEEWSVRNGLVKLTQAQHINVLDCKNQKYISTINGEQLVVSGDNKLMESYNLGSLIIEDPWVKAVSVIDSRFVKIEHGEGTGIVGSIKTEFKPLMLTHSSQFESFNGTLQLDKYSNRFMNVSFFEAKGTLIGTIFSSEAKDRGDLSFSVQIDGTSTRDYNFNVAVPPSVNGSRYVCVHPSGDYMGQHCVWMTFNEVPLETFTISNHWISDQAECHGCNEFTIESIIEKLDPQKMWKSLKDNAALYIGIPSFLIILYIVIRIACCINPLISCLFPAPHKK